MQAASLLNRLSVLKDAALISGWFSERAPAMGHSLEHVIIRYCVLQLLTQASGRWRIPLFFQCVPTCVGDPQSRALTNTHRLAVRACEPIVDQAPRA